MNRYCFALDLKESPKLIAAYVEAHKRVWPEVEAGFKATGIITLELYHVENRLFMIMDTQTGFSFKKKQTYDNAQPKIKQWETEMERYQKLLPNTLTGTKWRLMERIYNYTKPN